MSLTGSQAPLLNMKQTLLDSESVASSFSELTGTKVLNCELDITGLLFQINQIIPKVIPRYKYDSLPLGFNFLGEIQSC